MKKSRKQRDPSFEQWVAYIFDQPLDVSTERLLSWRERNYPDVWQTPPELIVSYMTWLFEEAGRVLEAFSDQQLRQGLWFLIQDNHILPGDRCSDHLYALFNVKVSLPQRQRCIYSMYTLFVQLFARRCTPALSHLGEKGANSLNAMCYEWWRALRSVENRVSLPITSTSVYAGLPPDLRSMFVLEERDYGQWEVSSAIDETVVSVLKKLLDLDSNACRESTLNGLQHWSGRHQQLHTDQLRVIIEDFLSRNPTLRPELKAYALQVGQGEGKQLTNVTFEEWIAYVFDHPVREACLAAWYHDLSSDYWKESSQPEVTLAYLTRVFEEANTVLLSFSPAQINQGFWFLASNSCSDHMFVLLNSDIPWPERKRCIEAMYTLFEQFFAQQCSPGLVRNSENPLNSVCMMWWDLIPIHGKPEEPEHANLDAAFLDIMRHTLGLAAIPCQEAALHGLGHWAYAYPEMVKDIIGSFLADHPDIDPQLEEYAQAAQHGHIQ